MIYDIVESTIANHLKKNPSLITEHLKAQEHVIDLEVRVSEIFKNVEKEFISKLLKEGLVKNEKTVKRVNK